MPFCENCGTPVCETENFCKNCGAAQKQQLPIPPPPPPEKSSQTPEQPQVSAEKISGFIIAQKQKRFQNPEYCTGILTSERLIFVPMTKENLKEVTAISRAQAKNNQNTEPTYPYQQNILAMGPAAVLAQNPNCITIQNSQINELKVTVVASVGDGYSDFQEFEMQLATYQGAYTFRMTKRNEYITRLKQVYPEKIKLPPNYT
jgi:hypothetical protein